MGCLSFLGCIGRDAVQTHMQASSANSEAAQLPKDSAAFWPEITSSTDTPAPQVSSTTLPIGSTARTDYIATIPDANRAETAEIGSVSEGVDKEKKGSTGPRETRQRADAATVAALYGPDLNTYAEVEEHSAAESTTNFSTIPSATNTEVIGASSLTCPGTILQTWSTADTAVSTTTSSGASTSTNHAENGSNATGGADAF